MLQIQMQGSGGGRWGWFCKERESRAPGRMRICSDALRVNRNVLGMGVCEYEACRQSSRWRRGVCHWSGGGGGERNRLGEAGMGVNGKRGKAGPRGGGEGLGSHSDGCHAELLTLEWGQAEGALPGTLAALQRG